MGRPTARKETRKEDLALRYCRPRAPRCWCVLLFCFRLWLVLFGDGYSKVV